jgi:hypothetical protein
MAKKKRIVIDLDQPQNEDWMQAARWDVWTHDGLLVENLEQLRSVFRSRSNRELKEFLLAPSAKVMPEQLRRELEALPANDDGPAYVWPI